MGWKSMTGYGQAEVVQNERTWHVEVRSVNNRFLDARVKLPREYAALEEHIRRRISEYHQRGRVDLTVTVNGGEGALLFIRVDRAVALAYRQAFAELAELTGADPAVPVQALAALPDVLVREQRREDLEAVSPVLEGVIVDALQNCLEMRKKEAAHLSSDLRQRLQSFSQVLQDIEGEVPVLVSQREVALKERLERLLGGVELDPLRLAQEVAVLADKTDVTEELVRLRSHISKFNDLFESAEPVGRTLDFLIQEFLREVNTIASKISDARIAHLAVSLKSELEKMREQIQNIE